MMIKHKTIDNDVRRYVPVKSFVKKRSEERQRRGIVLFCFVIVTI